MRYFLLSLCLLTGGLLPAQSFSGGFPFFLPPDDSSTQVFLPVFPPRPATDFIQVNTDGHFTAGGRPIRFWGVNLTTGACFPYPDEAPWIAARMRKMGINLVRFHHMDNPWTDNEGTIFRREWGTTRRLNPTTLDRLYFFLSQLKRNGVYANINLHVSRMFTPADGVAGADSIVEFGKAVTLFDRYLIQLQKDYARQLLATPNPYTGLTLAADPVVAMVEITNENTLYGFWRDDALRPFAEGGRLLSRHADTLDRRWLEFLRDRYPGDEALRAAWTPASSSDPGPGQIADGGFEATPGPLWALEQHNGATAAVVLDPAQAFSGQSSARISVDRATGADWHIQYKRIGLSIQRDSLYVVRFAARADRPRTIALTMQRDNAPYTWYAGRNLELTTEWQLFTYTFTATENNTGQMRVSFGLGAANGNVWIDAVSLGKPVGEGLRASESLTAGVVRRIPYSERLLFSPQRVADQAEYYLDLQTRYYEDMHRFLRDSLGVRAPITGSNALGGPAEVLTMRNLDYIDDHAYWDHPQFPGEAWSPTNWLIDNSSMLRDNRLGTVPGLFGGLALAGKPYTVSEYNHGYPNRYQPEMMPVLAAYLSLHDADGLMFFEYNGGDSRNWSTDRIDGYFSIHRNSALMALSPLYSYAFRQGLLQAADPLTVNYPPDYLYRQAPRLDNNGRWGKFFPYDAALAITRPVRIGGFEPAGAAPDPQALPSVGAPPYVTLTGETTFDPGRGMLRIQAPQLVTLAGPLDQLTGETAGPLRLVRGSAFGVLAWLALDERPLAEASRSLLALSARAQNTGMTWDGTNTVHDRWGQSPTTVQSLRVELSLTLAADSLRLYLLDPRGQEGNYRTFYPRSDGVFLLTLDQAVDRTLWYGLEAFGRLTSRSPTGSRVPEPMLYPNPVSDELWVEYRQEQTGPLRIDLLDSQGRRLYTYTYPESQAGDYRRRIDLTGLPAAFYYLRLRLGGGVLTRPLVKMPE